MIDSYQICKSCPKLLSSFLCQTIPTFTFHTLQNLCDVFTICLYWSCKIIWSLLPSHLPPLSSCSVPGARLKYFTCVVLFQAYNSGSYCTDEEIKLSVCLRLHINERAWILSGSAWPQNLCSQQLYCTAYLKIEVKCMSLLSYICSIERTALPVYKKIICTSIFQEIYIQAHNFFLAIMILCFCFMNK